MLKCMAIDHHDENKLYALTQQTDRWANGRVVDEHVRATMIRHKRVGVRGSLLSYIRLYQNYGRNARELANRR